MIQELLGGSAFIAGDRRVSFNGGNEEPTPFLSPSSSSTPALSSSPAQSAASSTSSEQNLKCPRCDSSNTKFCYYNNYNLTQPRHFCKTCRRYWTKGGALRNVPIGGGCRKNKSVTFSTMAGKASAGKMKTLSPEIGSSLVGNGLDREFSSSPMIWGSPQNSHILGLLRAAQNPSPSSSSIVNSLKDEAAMVGLGSRIVVEPATGNRPGALRSLAMGSEPLAQSSSIGFCNNLWGNNHLQGQQQINGSATGELQNSGIQQLYQWLRSSSNNHCDQPPVVSKNTASSFPSSASTVFDSNTVSGGQLGWNPAFSWPSDLPTTNGAYPS